MAKVSVTKNLRQRKFVRGNAALEVRHREVKTNVLFSVGSKLSLRHSQVFVITEFDTSKVGIQ